ncbi:unnamed protein product [Moneuplotes crassus]|uniref:WRKY domain-containing protein n=1 Tax=Euplotes crassus TaxID=5936 RepID=A0AAD1U6W2_EUPCR|nr:unnamed protein product [Moneuplotes crassus]
MQRFCIVLLSYFFEHKKDKSHPIQLTTTYQRSSVRKICVPNQHVKHIAYRNIYINDIEIQTPDMEDFCTQTIHCENYEDLGETVRILCLMKGFNIIFPRGDKYETILYWCECYGDRKGVQSTKRTGCDFKLQYERTPDKKGYFLYKYQSSHNHPLEERNMYLGDYAFQKMKVISRELRKVALNPQNSVKMEKLKNDSVDPREDYNYDQEYEDFINGIKPVEDMRVLRSFNRCVYNRKHIRIDAACKTRAFQKYERDDIQDIDQEGIESSQNMAGVYTNVKTYPFFPDSSNRHQTILHCAQEFELEILAKHYKRDLTEVILDLEEDSFEKYKLAQLSRKKDKIEPKIIEIPNKNLSNIEAKQKYMKLNQISHKVSPYCIYEVTSEWDDAQDGPPCDFLADTMPTYEIEGEYYIPSKTVTRKMKKEESVEEAENKEPETDSNISSIYDEKSDISLKSGSDAANDYSTRPRLSKDSIDIYADLDTEIMNDVQGIESNNTVIKKKSRQTKYDVSKEQDIKDEPEVRFFN